MHGARHNGLSIPEICIKALEAGNDMIMLSRTPDLNDAIWTNLMDRYTTSPDFRERIHQAVRRVLKTKLDYIKAPGGVPLFPDTDEIAATLPLDSGQEFFFDLACRSVTVIEDRTIPLTHLSGEENILLAGQFDKFMEEGLRRYPGADTFFFPYSPFHRSSKEVIRRLNDAASRYDYIIFCLANPNSLQVLESLESHHDKIIVVSVLTPIYLREVPWVESSIAVYGTGQESFEAGFAVLRGDYEAEGKIPLTVFRQ
jgi:beta-N-acetylhexosaminidase